MSRRWNHVKRNLPGLEIVTFHGSGRRSKRKLTLTTPDVVRQVNTSELPVEDKDFTEEQPMEPHVMDINDGNEGDDEDDSDDELENVTNYRKRQKRGSQGWKGIWDAMLQALVVVPDNATAKKFPSVEGMMVYRKDNKKVYVQGDKKLNALAEEKKVS